MIQHSLRSPTTPWLHSLSTLAELVQARVDVGRSADAVRDLCQIFRTCKYFMWLRYVMLGRTLWLLGFPDQALKTMREAEIGGNRSTNPVAKAFGLQTSEVRIWCGDFELVRENAQALLQAPWAAELNPVFPARADLVRGWLLAREGKPDGNSDDTRRDGKDGCDPLRPFPVAVRLDAGGSVRIRSGKSTRL